MKKRTSGFYRKGGIPNPKTLTTHETPWLTQAMAQEKYQMKTHTEDCLDANDDTSVLKGKCICPKPQHTPTPWKVWPENGTSITTPITEVTLARCIKTEDAAFIVRAVNCHEELVNQLTFLRDSLELDDDGKYTGYITKDSLKEVEAILSKAEGK